MSIAGCVSPSQLDAAAVLAAAAGAAVPLTPRVTAAPAVYRAELAGVRAFGFSLFSICVVFSPRLSLALLSSMCVFAG